MTGTYVVVVVMFVIVVGIVHGCRFAVFFAGCDVVVGGVFYRWFSVYTPLFC